MENKQKFVCLPIVVVCKQKRHGFPWVACVCWCGRGWVSVEVIVVSCGRERGCVHGWSCHRCIVGLKGVAVCRMVYYNVA